jgi:hypothetical protein
VARALRCSCLRFSRNTTFASDERRVDAAPDAVFAAIRSVTLAETPIARTLMRLRGMRAGSVRPLVEEMDAEGFAQVAEEPLREVVYAAIGQPWKPLGGKRAHAGDFRTFSDPGYAKLGFNFRLENGVLSTETRVLLTDERSRKLFRRYWLVIRPFSGLIRREWLRAIAQRAAG